MPKCVVSVSGAVPRRFPPLLPCHRVAVFLLHPLVRSVCADSPDTEIWAAAVGLIESVKLSTPPRTNVIPTYLGTPVKSSSSNLASSETRDDNVERELFLEIQDCTHRDVTGFFTKHLKLANWAKEKKEMFERIMARHNGNEWTDFPADPWEQPVWECLTGLEKDALGAPFNLHSNRTATQFYECKGQMDVFFQKPRQSNGKFWYRNVLVIGEHKRSYNTSNFKACMLKLTRDVRHVFTDQPLRRFVHAFTIQAAMSLDTFIELKENHRYVMAEDAQGKKKQMELNSLFVRQRAVVCRGTTCFRTPQGVAKFS